MDNSFVLKNSKSKEYSVKNWQLFLLVVGITTVLTLINDKFIMTHETFRILLADKMELNKIDDNYALLNRLKLYAYIAMPALLWLKIAVVALLLQTFLVLKNVEVGFKTTFKVALMGTISYVLMSCVKTLILIFTPLEKYTAELISSIPGSLTDIISVKNYSSTAVNFLSGINIYEGLWIMLLTISLRKLTAVTKSDSFLIVFSLWLGLTVLQNIMVYYLNNMY